jgi:hypothetical protein
MCFIRTFGRIQVNSADSSELAGTLNTLHTAGGHTEGISAMAAQVPFNTVAAARRKLAHSVAAFNAGTLSSLPRLYSGRSGALNGVPRKLQAASPASPYFDPNGDGRFSAADYVLLLQLGLAWSNEYASDASPWLARFRELTGGAAISNWQLQSTDPDSLCVPLQRRECTSMNGGRVPVLGLL